MEDTNQEEQHVDGAPEAEAQAGESQTEEVAENESVEDTEEKKTELSDQPATESAEFVPHGKIDPSFNCPDCLGEGIITNDLNPQGVICANCKGTGKV